jgi:hypothetical protein
MPSAEGGRSRHTKRKMEHEGQLRQRFFRVERPKTGSVHIDQAAIREAQLRDHRARQERECHEGTRQRRAEGVGTFEEPGTLSEVAWLGAECFIRDLLPQTRTPQ